MQTLQSWTKQFFKRELVATKSSDFSVDRNLRIPENKEVFKIFPSHAFRIEMRIHNTLSAKTDHIPNAALIRWRQHQEYRKKETFLQQFHSNSQEESWHYLIEFSLSEKKNMHGSSDYIVRWVLNSQAHKTCKIFYLFYVHCYKER